VAAVDGLPTLRLLPTEGGVALQRLDPVGARYLPLSRHEDLAGALARLLATLVVGGTRVTDVDSGTLGAAAAVAALADVLDPDGAHVDGIRWSRHDVGGTLRWLPAWPAPGLWVELERAEREWRTPRRGLSWQREVIARHGDVYVNATAGDVRDALVVAGAFADEAAGVAAARTLGLGLLDGATAALGAGTSGAGDGEAAPIAG
jgi:hypothetical protein